MDLPEYRTILLDQRDGVALITLNRPEQMNAFTPLMGRELGHLFTALEVSDEVRAIVVTGAGRAFCAGAALDDAGTTFQEGSATAEELGPAMSEISTWEMCTPVLAAINGPAVGLGLTYPLQWDIRVAAETAKLGFVFTRRGLIPEANCLWLLSRTVGASRALELLITGRTFTGAEAAEMGLVTKALPAGEVLDATMDLARDIAANTAPAAVAVTKKMFYEQLASNDRVGSRRVERAAFSWFVGQPDAHEGITSFLARRPPVWAMSKHATPHATDTDR